MFPLSNLLLPIIDNHKHITFMSGKCVVALSMEMRFLFHKSLSGMEQRSKFIIS